MQTLPHLLAQTPCSYLSITNTAQQLYNLVRKEKEKQRGEGQSQSDRFTRETDREGTERGHERERESVKPTDCDINKDKYI